jgi:ribosomal protein S18
MRLNDDDFLLYMDICKHFKNDKNFYKYDLPFFIKKNKMKMKYNLFDKFAIKKVINKHLSHKTISDAVKLSEEEIISFFKNYTFKEYSKFKSFMQEKKFEQMFLFLKNENCDFDLLKYKKYAIYKKFDTENGRILSFDLDNAKKEIKELLNKKILNDYQIIEKRFYDNINQKISLNYILQKEFSDLYQHSKGIHLRDVK